MAFASPNMFMPFSSFTIFQSMDRFEHLSYVGFRGRGMIPGYCACDGEMYPKGFGDGRYGSKTRSMIAALIVQTLVPMIFHLLLKMDCSGSAVTKWMNRFVILLGFALSTTLFLIVCHFSFDPVAWASAVDNPCPNCAQGCTPKRHCKRKYVC